MKVQNNDYDSFFAELSAASKFCLQKINGYTFKRCKYLIFPINSRVHWFLLVFHAKEGIFKMWNSLPDSFSLGACRTLARFLVGWVRHNSNFVIPDSNVLRERTRHQGESLDCGVFACMWVECLARDLAEMWEYQNTIKMDTYRARLAASILSHERGLLKNNST
ncbi:putative ubiquitin-like-specific protease 1B [Henckelia pumila]|uniref:putative ubiquitin-like-specific protease 1B n=1 Tax=Henckelia pumila TaxID=405737 RepID=UPI003C6DF330